MTVDMDVDMDKDAFYLLSPISYLLSPFLYNKRKNGGRCGYRVHIC